MRKTAFSRWIKPVLIFNLAFSLAFTATAQNYYPADIGNTWVLESIDGTARSTYTLEGPEIIGGTEHILLQIKTEELDTGEVDTDKYFLTVGSDAIKLHRTVLENSEPPATLTANLSTPATFFPLQLVLGDTWQIAVDAEAKLEIGLTLSGQSITDLEVVSIEDVVTPAGTFENCAKVQLDLLLTAGGFLNLGSTTYQWFAPDVGPIQYENSDGLLFSLTSSNLLSTSEPIPEPVPYDVTGDGVVNILDLTFAVSRFGESDADADVTGDGVVNILDLVLIAQNLSK